MITPDELREQMKHAIVYTSDMVPVVHGQWIYELWYMTCSNCGISLATTDDDGQEIPQNYCPNCGATMDKEDE